MTMEPTTALLDTPTASALTMARSPEMTVVLKAAPQDSDPEGMASRFVGNHEKLGVVQEYEGTITGVIDGTPYAGDFKEVAHDH